ncbi:hypothetical protein XGA_0762 [Xanthomonas hortorum ATCC 19865]|nr:hypothetical protein XGA_0762 [Xanthomonas hortorum ATCC 19865]
MLLTANAAGGRLALASRLVTPWGDPADDITRRRWLLQT